MVSFCVDEEKMLLCFVQLFGALTVMSDYYDFNLCVTKENDIKQKDIKNKEMDREVAKLKQFTKDEQVKKLLQKLF